MITVNLNDSKLKENLESIKKLQDHGIYTDEELQNIYNKKVVLDDKISTKHEEKKEIIIRTGDKVITADGRVGRVTSVCECEECEKRGFFEPTYEIKGDPEKHEIMISQYQKGFHDFYLIGKNFFGNKISQEEMERRIAEQRAVIEREKEKLDALRKQLWTLNERMVPDWREREEAHRNAKKAAEQQTD